MASRFPLSLTLVLFGVIPCAAGPVSVEGIAAEWQRYEAELRQQGFRGTATTEYRRESDAGQSLTTLTTAFACKGDGLRYEILPESKGNPSAGIQAFGMNGRYAFELRNRQPEAKQQSGNWLLHDIVVGTDPEAPLRSLVRDHSSHLFPLLDFNFLPLSQMPLSPQARANTSGQDTTTLAISGVTIRSFANAVFIHEAKLELAGNPYSVLQGGTAKIRMNKTDGVVTVSRQFRLVDGLPVPTKSVTVEDYSSASMKLILRRETTYEVELGGAFEGDEFTLTHYGLPEPPGVEWERPTPTYVWLLLAAGVLGVIAVGCRWLLKRRAKAVPPPVPPTPTA